MSSRSESRVAAALASLVDWAQRRARRIAVLYLVATVVAAAFTVRNLGFDTDGKNLLPPGLLTRAAAQEFERRFPSLDDALLVVVDGESGEAARSGARALAGRLRARPDRFESAVAPGMDPFFERNGLLYLSPEQLGEVTRRLADAQPMLFNLERLPRLDTLRHLVQFGIGRPPLVMGSPEQWALLLDQMRTAVERSFDAAPAPLSWESLLVVDPAGGDPRRQVLLVEPVLDFDALLPAARPLAEIRREAADLGLVPERGFRVRITGNPALNHEEMLGLAWDIGLSSALSFALVVVLLLLAFRSGRLAGAAAVHLLVGLIWTAAFAALAIGRLNLISIAFAVLFIGLGIDFAIHLGMHFVAAARGGGECRAALASATREVGTSLLLCAGTTAIGFFSFVPTEYRGVSELGWIAGTGMLVIVLQTVVLFPALVRLFLGEDPERSLRPALSLRLAPPSAVSRHPGAVVGVALLTALLAAAGALGVRFDSNVVTMRDPGSESVATFRDLLRAGTTSPWSLDVLAPSLPEAASVARRLHELPEVESAVTVLDWIPPGQDEKRAILEKVAPLFAPPDTPAAAATTPDEQKESLRRLRGILSRFEAAAAGESALRSSARRLGEEIERFLDRLAAAPDPSRPLENLEHLLLGGLEAQLGRLREALAPGEVSLATLPPEVLRHRLAADGWARVEVRPAVDLGDTRALARFVDAVRRVAPDATGVGLNVLEFGRATVRSFREAFALAFAAIALFVWLIWRRATETLLVLAPLVLSSLWTLGAMATLGMSFNFANVAVLPLLLGIGVDSGIHLVALSRTRSAADLLDSTAARAVFYSAATTIVSFGNLALSRHRGVASMGVLLVCGMLLMLVANLVVLPALLALRERRGGRRDLER